jgi:hypothetical protein
VPTTTGLAGERVRVSVMAAAGEKEVDDLALVAVGLGVEVSVGVGVGVGDSVAGRVAVGDGSGVASGGDTVAVGAGGSTVGAAGSAADVAVAVAIAVAVAVGADVSVGVAVGVAVSVGIGVSVGVEVSVSSTAARGGGVASSVVAARRPRPDTVAMRRMARAMPTRAARCRGTALAPKRGCERGAGRPACRPWAVSCQGFGRRQGVVKRIGIACRASPLRYGTVIVVGASAVARMVDCPDRTSTASRMMEKA